MALLHEYFGQTFSGELTNALFIAVVYGVIIADLRQHFPIERAFKEFKKWGWNLVWPVKLLCVLLYYTALITIGLLGVFLLVSVLWLISLATG